MIFLLGHKGFVGSAIAKLLREKGEDFVGIDRENYRDFVGKECDIFINAGGSSKKRLADQDPRKDFDLNVLSTLNTLLDFRSKKYILVSSIDVYHDVRNPKNNTEKSEIETWLLSNYGFSKVLCEQIVTKYAKEWLIFRLGGMVGEGLKKNAVFDLLNIKSLYVNPKSEYQYINTADVAKIIYRLRNKRNEIFNVCGDGTVMLEDVARKLGVNLGNDLYRLRREKYNVSITKLKRFARVEKTSKTVGDFIRG